MFHIPCQFPAGNLAGRWTLDFLPLRTGLTFRTRADTSAAVTKRDAVLGTNIKTVSSISEQQDQVFGPENKATTKSTTGSQHQTDFKDDADMGNGQGKTHLDEAVPSAPTLGTKIDKGKARAREPDDEDAILDQDEDIDLMESLDHNADEDEEVVHQPISARLRSRVQSATSAASTITTTNDTTPSLVTQPTTTNQAPAAPTVPPTAAPAPVATANSAAANTPGAPPNALGLDEHFVLGRPRPAGALVPTNRAMTSFEWVPRRGAVNFNNSRSVEMLNRWKQQLVRRACQRLGIVRDARATRRY